MKDGKQVIMHVEDSPTARELIKEALEEAGYIVYSADDASDMETRFMSDPEIRKSLDMFVLDMEMPDMLGAQVGAIYDTLYEELASTPFIIYSGKDEDWVKKMSAEVAEFSEGFRRNFKGHLLKGPGSEEKVIEKIKQVLDRIKEGG